MTQPISYTYQWKRNGGAIAGATDSTYDLRPADQAASMTCTVTASDAAGSTSETSEPSAGVAAAVTASFPIGVAIGNDPAVLYAPDDGLAQYRSMRSNGFTTIRMDVGYQTSGPSGNDATVRAAVDAGLEVLLLLDGYDISIGADAFAAWCYSVVAIYSAIGIHHYEVLNEENYFGNWDTSGAETVSAVGYAALLKASYAAIKRADGSATVLLGGMACVSATNGAALGHGNYARHLLPTTFISLVYEALGGSSAGAFDAVAVHPYTFPNVPGTTGDNFMNNLAPSGTTVRTIMVANGDAAKPIWVSEFGAPTGTTGGYVAMTEAEQITQLTRGIALCTGWGYIGAFYVFSWNDDATDGDFGLLDSGYMAKPALAQVKAYIGRNQLINATHL
jgi:hypothetical protein